MKLDFYKYEGTGNDFILLEHNSISAELKPEIIQKMCDRRFGIGADGLLLLKKDESCDFAMQYFNADGYEGSMCGNGARCSLAFFHKHNPGIKKISFRAVDGLHQGEVVSCVGNISMVKLRMGDTKDYFFGKKHFEINTGSPHYVEFVEDLNDKDVYILGKNIRNSSVYAAKGINVNFVEIKNAELYVRTYERGVENETLSCGTGVTAATLAYALKSNMQEGNVLIRTRGGSLSVSFIKRKNIFTEICLRGPATFVFKGNINI